MKAVIFDKDGVLADAVNFNVKAGILSFREIGIELDEEDKKNIVGRHPADYNLILAKKYDFDNEKLLERQRFHYYQLYPHVKLFEGAKELILNLKEKKLRLALATSAETKGTNIFLDKFDLREFFEVIITFGDCDKRKPAPDIYLKTADKLGVNPEECLVVEDSPIGVEAAKKSGMKCVAVMHTSSKEELKEADYIISNLNEFKYEWLE